MKALVVGAGFLGQEIIKIFKSENISILGTKRSNVNSLTDIIELDVHVPETFKFIPRDIDCLIYAVSAKSSDSFSYEEAYFKGISNVLNFKKNYLNQQTKIIFISSTGVYQEDLGNEVTEDSKLLELDPKYSHIINAEKLVLETNGIVLRLSGIYGEGRRYFIDYASRINTFNFNDLKWTNRIHKTDAARACLRLLSEDFSGVVNVSDTLPSVNFKCLNYIRKQNGLPEIDFSFDESKVLSGKKCFPIKLESFNFKFKYPSYIEGYI